MSIVDSDNVSAPPVWEKMSSEVQLQNTHSSEQHSSQMKASEDTERISICSTLAEGQNDGKEPCVTKIDIADNRSTTLSIQEVQKDMSLPLINGIRLLSIDIKSDDGFTENECDYSSDDLPAELVADKTDLQAYPNTSNESRSSISNGVSPSVMTELTCDTRLERKISTPDSGLSSELHESDAGSSCTSNRSNDINNDFLKSPVTSEASTDCSKDLNESFLETTVGSSTFEGSETYKVHEFEIPQDMCGLLIGRNGRHVKYLKDESNADILIKRHPIFPHLKSCAISGTEEEINTALMLIRDRFPADKFESLSMSPINDMQHEYPLPITVKLSLPEGVTFDVVLSNVVSPGHFFVHQPTHPTYHALSRLSNEMSELYNTVDTPSLFRISPGFIVAVPVAGGWYRAEVVQVCDDTDTAVVKLLDFGGFITTSVHQLRQMRYEYSFTPFQATECFLGNISCAEGESVWSEESKAAFEELCRGQILRGYITGYGDCNVPFVHLFNTRGTTTVFINRELVNQGFARWIEHEEATTTTSN